MSDFKTIREWLKLPPTQRLLATCAIIIIVLYIQWKRERDRNDFRAENSDKEKERRIAVLEEKVRICDSSNYAKDREIQLIYKSQAEEYKKARQEVEAIKKNSNIIRSKAEKLVRDK